MDELNTVLVIEDDSAIRHSLFHTLGALGFAVGAAANGEEGLARLRMASYDVVLLDINMPGMGGKQACRRISEAYPGIPIIMLTVRNDESDIIETLDSGASDYVTKPFQIGVLTARIRAAIRRHEASPEARSGISVAGGLTLDHGLRQVDKGGRKIHLTPREYETLKCMMSQPDRVLDHEHLLKTVWGPNYANEREYLRVMINQLRKKLEDDPAHPVHIVTISHVGYCFRTQADPIQQGIQ